MKVQITLKSGAQIEFRSGELTTRSRDGRFVGIDWDKKLGAHPRLHGIDVNEIAAVVVKGRAK
jgi:hypothetical protein